MAYPSSPPKDDNITTTTTAPMKNTATVTKPSQPPPPPPNQTEETKSNSEESEDPEDSESQFTLFADPQDYYPPSPPPTTQTYEPATARLLELNGSQPITLHLVGHSPLEAHHLWNGSRVVASHLEAHPSLVRGRNVLELGAGAGLPSLVAAALGAERTVVTDFPDPELVECLWRNIFGCEALGMGDDGDDDDDDDDKIDGEERKRKIKKIKKKIVAEGYVWGSDVGCLVKHLPPSSSSSLEKGEKRDEQEEGERKFDVVILADLLFRHSEHDHLLDSIEKAMRVHEDSVAFVVFTSYRPWLQHKDLRFFDLARERGFVVDKVLEKKMERPLFENDPGDEEVRKTVTGWFVKWPREFVEGRMEWPANKGVGRGEERNE